MILISMEGKTSFRFFDPIEKVILCLLIFFTVEC